MNIALASDHAGFHLKENIKQYLINEGYEIADCGTYSEESCDYPDFADAAVKNILKGKSDCGIFVCGTGIG
ncbi:MAG: RpiB/LacA/LacB family sugar-phosphate isomerase, partial [Mucispirillum sp.]|nr:RpiB/LacA/LacB family sugar-phosphate isomerase [Mucispirillum sp.]